MPLMPVHVAGGDRVERREVARMALGIEPRADGGQHGVGAAEAARRADGDDGAVRDQRRGLRGREHPHPRHRQDSPSTFDRASPGAPRAPSAARRRPAPASARRPRRSRPAGPRRGSRRGSGAARARRGSRARPAASRPGRRCAAPPPRPGAGVMTSRADQRALAAVDLEAGAGVSGREGLVDLGEQAGAEADHRHRRRPRARPWPCPRSARCATTSTGSSPSTKRSVSASWTVMSSTTPPPASGRSMRQPCRCGGR